jgi:FlaA1/EpsC-like NDP-sugar epimerase
MHLTCGGRGDGSSRMLDKALNTGWLRRGAVVGAHVLLWAIAFGLALELRFDGDIPEPYRTTWLPAVAVLLFVRVLAFRLTGLFHGLWRYAGMPELKSILRSTTAGTVAFIGAGAMVHRLQMPRSIYVGEWLASIVLIGGVRFIIRIARERSPAQPNPNAIRTLIVGLGDAGESLLRDVQRAPDGKWEIVGFLDDDPLKQDALVRGVRVVGRADDQTLTSVISRLGVGLVVLAISQAGKRTREILRVCRQLNVQTKTIPTLAGRLEGALSFSALREIAIDDLLRREAVQLDVERVSGFLERRTLLITGGGGSIGSELARQVLRFGPAKLILFEHDENALFHIERELRQMYGDANIVPVIGDICDAGRVEQIFKRYRPEVVFHAAAHKHVPMMEANACEAIKNNVFGTLVVADAARAHGADAFVMISTDKAVNPTSVMGATKRVAEMVLQSRSDQEGTRLVAVRFGNVLGSAGSVVPLFREQIAKGGPVTVTHPEMRRYFMTIPEAAQLVLQAGAQGNGGEIFLLDMGEPVRIVDLAKDLIELSGLRPEVDIPIQFTGLRPGEKLFEELLLSDEAYDKTPHPKIVVGRIQPRSRDLLQRGLVSLRHAAELADDKRARIVLSELVPEASLSGVETQPSAAAAELSLGTSEDARPA